jgi:ubiquinone/menaquinone biosynthesis C-methylase UbiE
MTDDPDPEMIALARNQAAERGIGNVDFIVARAEELDFAPRSFDAILCRWSLMFVDDLEACLSRLRPLLRPGGHLVAATWGPPERAPALSLARWTIHRHLGRTPPPQGAKTAFALSDADRLLETFRAAGFLKASQEWLPVAFEFHDMIE